MTCKHPNDGRNMLLAKWGDPDKVGFSWTAQAYWIMCYIK